MAINANSLTYFQKELSYTEIEYYPGYGNLRLFQLLQIIWPLRQLRQRQHFGKNIEDSENAKVIEISGDIKD